VIYNASLTYVLSVFVFAGKADKEIDKLLTYGPDGDKMKKQSK